MQYRAKHNIEAIQFDGKNVTWVEVNEESKQPSDKYFVRLGSGIAFVQIGDYFIKKPEGGFEFMSKVAFESVYEPVVEIKKEEVKEEKKPVETKEPKKPAKGK